MRDGFGDDGPGPTEDTIPQWPVPAVGGPAPAQDATPRSAYPPPEPGVTAQDAYPPPEPGADAWDAYSPAEPRVTARGGYPQPVPGTGHRARAARARRSRRARGGRLVRLAVVAGLLAGAAGLAVSVLGVMVQIMPRSFTPAQREKLVTWEIGKRWRSWQAGQIFPQTVRYSLSGRAFGGGSSLPLTAQLVGIAPQATCRAATQNAAARVLARSGCTAVLRATYEDTTQTLAVTIGIAVLPGIPAAKKSAAALGKPGDPRSGVRAVPFRRTATARFGDRSQKLSWDGVAGPYLVLATVGYADGRPWLTRGGDTYTQAELLGLASGAGQRVAAALGATPPPPQCPGNPAC